MKSLPEDFRFWYLFFFKEYIPFSDFHTKWLRSIDTLFPTKTAQNETKPFGVTHYYLKYTALYRGVPLRTVPQFICNKHILLPVCIRILWIFLLVSLQDFPCLIRFVIIFQHINLFCNKNVPHSIMFH